MKLYFILFLTLMLGSGCSVLINPDLENASDAFNNGYYQSAIHYANQILNKDSLSAGAYIVRGKARSKLNESESALRDFNIAIKIAPGFDGYYNRGLEYLKNNYLPSALADFDSAITFDNRNPEAFFTRAYAKYLSDDLEGSMKDYKKVIEQDSTYFKAYINLGNILGTLGYGEQAIEFFSIAITLQPDNADGYFNRGNQKLIMNDLSGGIKDLEKSLVVDKNNVNALFLLAELKIKANDNLGSLEILNRILSIEENPKALFMRGSIYLKLEDRNKGCADLNRAGELGYFDAYELINKYCVTPKKKK